MPDRVVMLHLGPDESPSAWSEALSRRPWLGGQRIKRDGDRSVWKAPVLGSMVAVKVRPASRLRARAGLTEFSRAVRAEARLHKAGVDTAPVFAHALVGSDEVLIAAWLEGPTLLHALADADPATRRDLLEAAGALVGRQLARYLFNRDHKPSNIVVESVADGRLALVDIGGVRKPPLTSASGLVMACTRMCAALVIEPRGVGIDLDDNAIDAAVTAAAIGATSTWSEITVAELRSRVLTGIRDTIASHGDAKPRVNPLDPPVT